MNKLLLLAGAMVALASPAMASPMPAFGTVNYDLACSAAMLSEFDRDSGTGPHITQVAYGFYRGRLNVRGIDPSLRLAAAAYVSIDESLRTAFVGTCLINVMQAIKLGDPNP